MARMICGRGHVTRDVYDTCTINNLLLRSSCAHPGDLFVVLWRPVRLKTPPLVPASVRPHGNNGVATLHRLVDERHDLGAACTPSMPATSNHQGTGSSHHQRLLARMSNPHVAGRRVPRQVGQLGEAKPNCVTYWRQPWKASITPLMSPCGAVRTTSLSCKTCPDV